MVDAAAYTIYPVTFIAQCTVVYDKNFIKIFEMTWHTQRFPLISKDSGDMT